MEPQRAVSHVFQQLTDSLNQLNDHQYNHPCKNLNGNTVGRHVRHIIEMFQCLQTGYETGELDYEKRNRDSQIETDKILATELLNHIRAQLSIENKPLVLHSYYNVMAIHPEVIPTNYFREIGYNIEHTIHHMALIRVGLREIGNITVDDTYGVAISTLKYRQQCVQ